MLQIASLPEILNVQLLRFVFDLKTMCKLKVKTAVDIPITLDFSELEGVLSDDLKERAKSGESPDYFVYDLVAVLFHKGMRFLLF